MTFGEFADAQWAHGVVSASMGRLCGVIWASYGGWGGVVCLLGTS